MLVLSFKYKMIQSDSWLSLPLTAEDYFDLDTDEELEIWSIPKSNHLLDYIENDRKNVAAIVLTISDSIKNETLTFKQRFWNNQQNYLLESIEEKQGNINVELILQILVQDDPNEQIWEIIRFSRIDGLLSPTWHSFIKENQTGLISEEIILNQPNIKKNS